MSQGTNSHHPEFYSAIQERHGVAAADPSAPSKFFGLAAGLSQSCKEKSFATGNFAIVVVVRRQQVEHLVILESRQMARHSRQVNSCFQFNRRRSADVNLPVTDRSVNNTLTIGTFPV